MIHELLTEGEANTITGKELADYFKCDIREITAQIERERRDGHPICASPAGGYFLPANAGELEKYCTRVHHRAAQLYKTRRALLNVLQQMLEQKKAQEITSDDTAAKD